MKRLSLLQLLVSCWWALADEVCSMPSDTVVIWLHGLGDTGNGWSNLRREFGTRFSHIEWLFPDAPTQPVTVNGGMEMTSWFDIDTIPITPLFQDDEKGLMESVSRVHDLARQKEQQGIASTRIFFGGFSQGAVVSYLAGLMYSKPIGGIIAFSGWLPLQSKLSQLSQQHLHPLHVLICHGKEDAVVDYALSERAHKALQDLHKQSTINFHSYDNMGHSSSPEEMKHLRDWLEAHAR